MKKSRFTEEQNHRGVEAARGPGENAELCREHGGQRCDLLTVEVEVGWDGSKRGAAS
jgi:hypothetical protein